jgi:GntR family transcriptional regulator
MSNQAVRNVAGAAEQAVFLPLYKQIKQLLIARMEEGEWKPGEVIPSEQELAGRFQVSQGTVRKAIDELAAENLLVRRQGKGTFVSTHHEAHTRFRFLRLAPDEGEMPATASRFIDCKRVKPPAEIAGALELRGAEPAVFMRRLLLVNERPLVLDEIWLPGAPFKALTSERLANYRGPLYALFETEFGMQMIRARERIRAVAASAEQAGFLAAPAGSPLLKIERTSYTYGERPVEVRHSLCVTTQHHYRNELY